MQTLTACTNLMFKGRVQVYQEEKVQADKRLQGKSSVLRQYPSSWCLLKVQANLKLQEHSDLLWLGTLRKVEFKETLSSKRRLVL
jgi:hypothetical protein